MVIITYCLAVFAFCIAFYFTRPLATCSQIFVIVNQAVKTIANKNIDDATKEKTTQGAAIDILKNSFSLLFKFSGIFGAAVVPVWLADISEIVEFSEINAFALRLDVLLITTFVASAVVFLGIKLFRKQ